MKLSHADLTMLPLVESRHMQFEKDYNPLSAAYARHDKALGEDLAMPLTLRPCLHVCKNHPILPGMDLPYGLTAGIVDHFSPDPPVP